MSSPNSIDNSQQHLRFYYIITEWPCIVFVTLFGLSTFVHTAQALHSRYWWLFPSAILCGLLEIAGWSGRLWASRNPYIVPPLTLQAVTLVLAPTPLVATNFILLGCIIRRLGPQYSRLTPRRYTIIFVCCDIIALVVQGVGGSIISDSLAQNSPSQANHLANLVRHIALGGTVFQLVSIIVYCSLAAEFLARYTRDQPVRRSASDGVFRGKKDERLNRMLQAMLIMTTLIMIRTIYRVVEFVSGLNGKVLKTQWLFNVFDAIMIILAMLTLNLFHPGIYLRDDHPYPSPEAQTFPAGLEGTVLEDFKKTELQSSITSIPQ